MIKTYRAPLHFFIVLVWLLVPAKVFADIYVYEKADGSIVALDYQLSDQQMSERGLQLRSAEASSRRPSPLARHLPPQFRSVPNGNPSEPSSTPVVEQDYAQMERLLKLQQESAAENEQRQRQLEWERAERAKEEAERQRKAAVQMQRERYDLQRRLAQEQDEMSRKREEEQREAEYRKAWDRKYMRIDVPPDQNINIRYR